MALSSRRPWFPGGCRLLATCLLAAPLARAEPLLAYVKGQAIYTARAADGSHEQRVCVGDAPCISHDGRLLAYTRSNGAPGADSTRTIVVRELASGREIDLPADTRRQVFGALWSPDDTWVAYNALGEGGWQVGVVHPDGTTFHRLTDQLPEHDGGYFLAGWNLHDGAVLAQNCRVAVQLDPATGKAAWLRPVAQFTGGQSASSETRFTVCANGRQLVYARETDKNEIPALANLAETSCYLVIADFPTGTPRRVTPAKFSVSTPYVDTGSGAIFLSGFGLRDVKPRRGGDGVDIKQRLYRFDLRSGRLAPLVEGGAQPSVSRE